MHFTPDNPSIYQLSEARSTFSNILRTVKWFLLVSYPNRKRWMLMFTQLRTWSREVTTKLLLFGRLQTRAENLCWRYWVAERNFLCTFVEKINLLFKPWRTVKLLMCASPCVYKSSYLHLLIVAVCSLTFKQFFRYALFHEGSWRLDHRRWRKQRREVDLVGLRGIKV